MKGILDQLASKVVSESKGTVEAIAKETRMRNLKNAIEKRAADAAEGTPVRTRTRTSSLSVATPGND